MRRALLALALLALAACSKNSVIHPPAKLTEYPPTLRVQRIWSADVSGTKQPLRLGLALAVKGQRVFAAGRDGDVAAFDVATGHRVWRTETRVRMLAGGPGVGGDLLAIGSSNGDVIALGTKDGKIRWHVHVGGEVLAPPAVTPRVVVVRTVDGKLHGLAVSDGHELWQVEQPVPSLSLRGTSRPTVAGNLAICGFDNGKLVAVNDLSGETAWEAQITPPHGRTAIESLIDIDSAAKVSGDDIFVVGFQGRVAMLARDTGQVWWSHDASSYAGLGLDDHAVYVADADGNVVALRRDTGAQIWRQSTLAYRGLTAPAVSKIALAVADYQGYVHWIDPATGSLMARASTGGKRVINPPVWVGDILLVINDDGRITAFKAGPRLTKK